MTDQNQFERWIRIWNMQHPPPNDEVQKAACFVHDVLQLAQKSANTLFLGDDEQKYTEGQRQEHMVSATIAIYDRIWEQIQASSGAMTKVETT